MAKIQGMPFFIYFKRSLNFIIKSNIILIIHLFFEYMDIYVNYIDFSSQLFCYGVSYNNKKTFNYIKYLTPYRYIFKFHRDTFFASFSYADLSIIVYFFLFVIYFLLFFLSTDFNSNKVTFVSKILNTVYINFYDYLFFRTFSIFGINSIIHNIIKLSRLDFSAVNIVLLIVSILYVFFIFIFFIKYFKTFSIWSTFKTHKNVFNKYPFDNFISMRYDMALLVMKIVVSISRNNLYFNDKIVDMFQIFINIIGIALHVLIAIASWYYFFFQKRELTYILLNKGNLTRIFFMQFGSVSLILRIMFHEDNKLFIISLIICFILVFFPLCLAFRPYLIYNAENCQHFLGVSWFFQSNTIESNNFITQWVMNHKATCTKAKCDIFSEIFTDIETGSLTTKATISKEKRTSILKTKIDVAFVSNLFALKSNNKRNDEGTMSDYISYKFNNILISKAYLKSNELSKDDLIRLDFLFLNVLFLEKGNQQFRLFNTLSKLIAKYKEDTNALISFMLVFEIIRKSNKELIQNYKLIRKSEDLRGVLKTYMDDLEHFIHLEMKTPENFVAISQKFRGVKDNTKILYNLFKKNPETNYQLIILRYLFENILHTKIKGFHNDFDINYYEEFLDFHYLNDRLFLVKYSIDKKDFTIIKGSKKLLRFKNQSLDALFPEFAKEKGQEIFENQLKSHFASKTNIFEYIIRDLNHTEIMAYVQPFKMKYYVYPSNKDREMLIQAHYIVDYTNTIIFEVLNSSDEEYLYSLSFKLFKFFGLTPEMISILSKAGKHITFKDLFHKPTLNIQKANNVCVFQYIRYARLYKTLIKCDGLAECVKYEDCKNSVKEIVQHGIDQHEIVFIVQEKFSIYNSKSKYIIYHIKEYKPKTTTLKNTKDFTKTIDFMKNNLSVDSSENKEQFDPVFKYDNPVGTTQGPTLSAFSTASVSVSSMNSMESSLSVKNKKMLHDKEKKLRYRQVNSFTLLIFCFGLLLMAITLIFLVLEITQNNTFQSLFQLFQIFKYFKRGVDASPLSILSNLCYYNETTGDCDDYFIEYSKDLMDKQTDLANFPYVSKLVSEEIQLKFQKIIARFNNFQNEIYSLNFGSINSISQLTTEEQIIVQAGNGIFLQKSNSNVVDMIRTYNNYINTIIEDHNYLREPIYIFTVNDMTGEMRIQKDGVKLTNTQKSIYLMIVNYPVLHKSMNVISEIIEDGFSGYLKHINLILYTFSILLLCLHLVLCGICIFFLKVFIGMIKGNIIGMLNLFTSKNFIEFIDRRILNLKVMCELYEDNPLKTIDKISTGDDAYRKLQKDLHKKESQNERKKKEDKLPEQQSLIAEDSTRGIREIRGKDFDKIIMKYKVTIIILFSVYSIYSIIYFIFLVFAYDRLESLVNYCKANTEVDNLIYDNYNALQYLRMTNSTSQLLGMLINENITQDYVNDGIVNFYSYVEYKEKMESMHSSIFPPLSSKVNLNCSEFQIEDNFIVQTSEILKCDFHKYYKNLCSIFPVTTYGSENTMLREILYLTNQIYTEYKQGDFSVLQKNIRSQSSYDLFTFTLIFIRVIRTYFNENLFSEEVSKTFNYFSVLIITYLGLNLFLEIVIFLIINFFVISRIKSMNKRLVKFIHSLKF